MPIYEYLCQSCGKKFEVLQKFSDAPLQVHEECGSGPVEKLISTSALQFKGSGWYVNDYAKGGASNKTGETKSGSKSESHSSDSGASGSDSKSESKSTATTESKPATTSESKPAASSSSADSK